MHSLAVKIHRPDGNYLAKYRGKRPSPDKRIVGMWEFNLGIQTNQVAVDENEGAVDVKIPAQ